MALVFNPQGKKTMLTIDGGGAKGIIPLMALKKLEAETGQPCHDLFDFVSGTSVGAIIAGGLAAGISAHELVALYERLVRDVFKLSLLAILFKHRLRYIYDKHALREAMRAAVGDVTLARLKTAVLITVKDMARAETIFFTNYGPGAPATSGFSLAEVVEASASAPVYFQPVGDAVDGGVGAYGNTSYVATVEALEYFSRKDPDWRDGNVIHLSFGTGLPSNRIKRGQVRRWFPWRWPLWVIGEALEEAAEINVRATVRHFSKRIDFRRYQVALEDEIVLNELGVDIPDGLRSNDLNMASASRKEIDLLKSIGESFAEDLDFALTGEELGWQPPPGYSGSFYPSRLPDLTPGHLRAMFKGKP